MNGVLLIDKSIGPTSHDVVAKVRRALGIRSIGHAGTLDPMASGLLVLLVGEATKISDYLLNGDKAYEVVARLGVRTDSMDMTGVVLDEASTEALSRLTEAEVRSTVMAMGGTLELPVPVHSAVKVNGKKLYEFAHRGDVPEDVPVREMSFYDIEFRGWNPVTFEATVHLRASKGSFIRAWGNELGRRLGVGGSVAALRRTESQPFHVGQAISVETLQERWESRASRSGDCLGSAWVELPEALPHFLRLEIEGQDVKLMRNGQISKGLQAELLRHIKLGEAPRPVRVINSEEGCLLALLVAQPGEFYKIRRVFVD